MKKIVIKIFTFKVCMLSFLYRLDPSSAELTSYMDKENVKGVKVARLFAGKSYLVTLARDADISKAYRDSHRQNLMPISGLETG